MRIPRNVSRLDRVIRIVAGILLLLLAPLVLSGTSWGWLGLVGISLVVSGTLGFCVTYWVLGTGTARDPLAAGRGDRKLSSTSNRTLQL